MITSSKRVIRGLEQEGFSEDFAEVASVERMYSACCFCERTPIIHELRGIEGLVEEPYDLDLHVSLWMDVAKFQGDNFGLVVMFPWANTKTDRNGESHVNFFDRVRVFTKGSAEECKRVLGMITISLWKLYCRSNVIKKLARKIPDKIFFLAIKRKDGMIMKFVPHWYVNDAAYFHNKKHGCNWKSSWFAAKNWFIAQGFVFWEEWGEGLLPPTKRFQGKIYQETFFVPLISKKLKLCYNSEASGIF